ncbi:Na+/Pi-cotransporter [Sulfurimonas denitrificans DSM 1251]|uniref:Na+/Pi-cotransporter n=1 Tax=Sulfurimonas denitrificans (strain ATCC 33889 / DSM 1251) TaxID=326298 RepID=Q30RZ1_SULDN|nr:Na/Pi symporter [Sulfurimonas denitrificans]ABB44240.1 Na+/Pi-cotransporter [Sulfurimonas denitrificans DSM 1251]
MSKKLLIPLSFLFFAYFVITSQNFAVLLSGIAIFIIGMFFMQDGFRLLSGGVLDKLLQKFTSNLFYSILTGVISTSLVQSSTIISLIVISFLSVELLSLVQGVGIIFGANLGSTTTAWIISSLGVDVKISVYAMPLIVFGVILRFAASNAYKGLGNVLLGLGFIFLGIAYMKDGFDTLKDSIDLASYSMDGVLGILVYIFIGIIVTVVIQSSAATLAIVITALNAGSIIYVNALSLTIGANLGTTLTAILASLASNENGKRVAFAYFVFNLVTAVIVTLFLHYISGFIELIAPYLGIDSENYGMKIALFHTLFSIIGLLVLSPFVNKIVKLSERLIKKKVKAHSKPKFLLDANITLPDAAIVSIKKEIINLYENCQRAMFHAINLHTSNLKTKEDLEVQISQEVTNINADIDEIYQSNLKILYSEIIKYSSFAQEYMTSSQHVEAGDLKRSAKIIVEVLKDTRDIQKNLNFYLKSRNEYIKNEYNMLRKELASILIDINIISSTEDTLERFVQLEMLKSSIQKGDLISTEKIDNLIREDKIKATMATSLINDSATIYSTKKKLVEVASTLFIDKNLIA